MPDLRIIPWFSHVPMDAGLALPATGQHLFCLSDGQRYVTRQLLGLAHREEYYAASWNSDGTYTTPSASTLDAIFAQVDDLEDELMTEHADINTHGWDGALWRKLPLIFGFSSNWDVSLSGTATGATYIKSGGTVPAGEIWILNAMSIQNLTRACGGVYLQVMRVSGGILTIAYSGALAQYAPLVFTGTVLLAAGDFAYLYVGGTQNGDALVGCISGYKMKIAE